MRLNGIDHITGITADGQRCLDFYAGILGLAFIGRDQDFEAPDSHLIRLGPEPSRPDGILAFIEAPGVGRGQPGSGMGHLIRWSVRFPRALDYWAERLADAGIEVHPLDAEHGPRLRFTDPEGLSHELAVESKPVGVGLAPGSSAIPHRHAIVRLAGVRAYGRESVPSADVLAGRLGFRATGTDSYAVGEGGQRAAFCFDKPPPRRGRIGAGTIHHVAWATDGSLPAWRQRVIGMGCAATPVIDRGHCHSIFFQEPSGVLFEIVTSSEISVRQATGSRTRKGSLSPSVDPRLHAGAI
jgi:glyoxalase family protein